MKTHKKFNPLIHQISWWIFNPTSRSFSISIHNACVWYDIYFFWNIIQVLATLQITFVKKIFTSFILILFKVFIIILIIFCVKNEKIHKIFLFYLLNSSPKNLKYNFCSINFKVDFISILLFVWTLWCDCEFSHLQLS